VLVRHAFAAGDLRWYEAANQWTAMLDRVTPEASDAARATQRAAARPPALRMRLALRQLLFPLGSSLVRRILLVNLGGLVALLLGFLWLNQTRVSVIDARVQSLQLQGEIIAAAVAGTATVDGEAITIDPERLLNLQSGEVSQDDILSALEFSLNPERVAPILQRLVTPTRLRARVYDRDGSLIIDTRAFFAGRDVFRSELPPPAGEQTIFERSWSMWKKSFGKAAIPTLEDTASGRAPQEVGRALQGLTANVVRVNAQGDTIISAAFPIQRLRTVRGALQLSTQDGDIDEVIAAERLNIFILFGSVTLTMLLISLLMANTIAKPVERLAVGAERVRRSIKSRHQIPDFTDRGDEIGHLSAALREMTNALYNRIAAIESFAADVAHELKNPLTSLRSAVETLPRVKDDNARARLLQVIQHDVKRLDRLISDISDASRLDAELAKADAEPLDMAKLADAVVSLARDMQKPGEAAITLAITKPKPPKGRSAHDAFIIMGHDSRLGQVLTNLLDNARSFAPAGTAIGITVSRKQDQVILEVEDSGPGVPEHAVERIFERFYTDRPPEQGFGQNSGLGLSISRQIIEAHRGTIAVENRPLPPGSPPDMTSGGARFIVSLPAAISFA
jgi:two-component system, OmpR family, sensor histidine kinase ChvG